MVTAHAPTDTAAAFEAVYAEAAGDISRVPWDRGRPHPALVTWLNVVAPSLTRCGARVAVVGCGLGHDARELIRRGYDVVAFDWSATAVEWARQLAPEHAGCFHVADLFTLPGRWRHRFDLVTEVNTIQSLPPERRIDSITAMTELLSPHGHLLVICRAATPGQDPADGPPWPLTAAQLEEATAAAGLEPAEPVVAFLDDQTPPVPRLRAVFRRGRGGGRGGTD